MVVSGDGVRIVTLLDRPHGAGLVGGVAMLLALMSCGSQTGRVYPTAVPDVGPVVVDLDAAHPTSLDLSSLEDGAAPKVPWIEGYVLHSGAGNVTVGPAREPLGYGSLVLPYGDGALREVTTTLSGGRTPPLLEVLAADGTVRSRVHASDPLRSPDGARAAWWDYEKRELVVAELGSGTELRRTPGPTEWALRAWDDRPRLTVTVEGWLGGDDVLVAWSTLEQLDGSGVWRSSGKEVPSWFEVTGSGRPFFSAEAGMVLRSSRPEAYLGSAVDGSCLDAVDLRTGEPLWRHCYRHAAQTYGLGEPVFGPDGKHVLLRAGNCTGGDPGYVVALDTRTGQISAEFLTGLQEGDLYGYPNEIAEVAFEDDEHFAAVLFNRTHRNGEPIDETTEAIVRCEVEGGCELATRPVTYRDDAMGGVQAPYWVY
jgi:hypothetical protein